MEKAWEESKDGVYDVFYSPEGKKIVVLEGLSIEDTNQDHYLQSLIKQNYDSVELFYWLLFFGSLLYMLIRHLLLPIYRKSNWF